MLGNRGPKGRDCQHEASIGAPTERDAFAKTESAWERDVKHAVPEFSVEEVDRAGEMLIEFPDIPEFMYDWTKQDREKFEEWNNAYNVVDNWRASHSFPLNTFQTTLRDKAHRVDSSCFTAQRLKRLWSIEAKLSRRKFKLSEIQDIGGCRAILKSVEHVDKLVEIYSTSDLKHKLERVDDYIRHPKASGYRGVHLIYSYYSDRKDTYNGHKIEMQFRSPLQHAWATAVETVGTFTSQALKSSRGNKQWLRFFQLMGSAIALREKLPIVPHTPTSCRALIDDLLRYSDELDAISRMQSYGAALRVLDENTENAHYFLIRLETGAQTVTTIGFKKNELEKAEQQYAALEKQIARAKGGDAVLVSAASLATLKRAYPNYFADTRLFIEALENALK